VSESPDDGARFDAHLDVTTTPEVAEIARAVRSVVLREFPGAVEWFDGGNGLLAVGARRSMRDLLFAVIPHRSWVNLQLADGVELPDPTGIVEGTGKRIRHVKVRSVDAARSGPIRDIVRAQVTHRG
jgi:hypothetical protein